MVFLSLDHDDRSERKIENRKGGDRRVSFKPSGGGGGSGGGHRNFRGLSELAIRPLLALDDDATMAHNSNRDVGFLFFF